MRNTRTLRRQRMIALAVSASLGLGIGAAPAASAQTGMTARTSITATTHLTAPTPVVPSGTSFSPLRSPASNAPGGTSTDLPSQNAIPIWAVRAAVKTAMFTLKKTARSWYNAIINKVAQGRAVFVRWWDDKVPSWIKRTFAFGGTAISGGAVYDAVKWLFGL